MEYLYEVSKKDLVKLGLKPTKAKNYCITQNGWSCKFEKMYEDLGGFRGSVITDTLTDNQADYIIKNCESIQY